MNYTEFRKFYKENVYKEYLNNNIAISRANLTNLYNEGCKNPRATLYQIASCNREIIKEHKQDMKKIYAQKNWIEASNRIDTHFSFLTESVESTHPMVKNAQSRIYDSFKKMYPDQKTQKFSKVLIFKASHPILDKFKFLLKAFL